MKLYVVLCLILCWAATCANGAPVLSLDDDNALRLAATHDEDPSVRRFAKHDLCRHTPGQRRLYLAIKSKMCDLPDIFVAHLVIDMCRQRYWSDTQLIHWVGELFDINGDGKISNFEKHQKYDADD